MATKARVPMVANVVGKKDTKRKALAFKEPRNFLELDEGNEAKCNEPQDHVSMEELEDCLKEVNWFAK
jgi:hypothetical protein